MNSTSKMSVEDTLAKFTAKMLSMDVFHCSTCHNLLKAPIMRIPEHGGNICSECWQTNKWPTATPNPEMELILNELKFPCKFQSTGCKENIQFKDLEYHESACKYHTKKCLLSDEGCEWQGIQTNFAAHFVEKHSEHTVNSNTNQFDIEIDLDAETNLVKLLKGRKHTCIITIQNSLINDSIIYTVYDIRGSSNTSDQKCTIKHKGPSSNSIETKCKVQSSLNSDFTEPTTNGARMDLSVLKRVTEAQDAITLIITINSCDDVQELDDKMLHFFECPVCKNLMKPPIYQCKFGHSFCNVCKPKLEKCPTCRGIFGNTRNYSLEGLTSGIQYACAYHHLGCGEALGVNDNGKHETLCIYKPYPCPLAECSFKGNYTTIIAHLRNLHPDKVVATNRYNNTMEFRLDQLTDFFNFQQKLFMVFDDNVFRLSFKRNSDYSFWAVEVLRKYDENAVFIYEIGIIDMRKSDRKLIRTDLCFNESNSDELFKKCILFPNNIISSYASNGLFTYYCQVYKRT